MCQYHSEASTVKLRRRLKNGKKIFWKVYRYARWGISSPCRTNGVPITGPGIVKAIPEEKDFSDLVNYSSVEGGAIHVFLNREDARDYVRFEGEVVTPVICQEKDLVSCGVTRTIGKMVTTAAFRQIEILDKDFPR